jgi:hypothetical protein
MTAEDDFVMAPPPKPAITQEDDFGYMPPKTKEVVPELKVPKDYQQLVFSGDASISSPGPSPSAGVNPNPSQKSEPGPEQLKVPKDYKELVFVAESVSQEAAPPALHVPKDPKALVFPTGSITPDARVSPSAEDQGSLRRAEVRPVRRASSGLTQSQVLEMVLDFVNKIMSPDPDYKDVVPIGNETKLLEAAQDGIMLSRLINHVVPNTIDERSLIHTRPLTNYQKTENLRVALNGATLIGCVSMLITPHMVMQGKSILVIGLLDQLRKIEMLEHINKCPDLVELAEHGETLEDVYALPNDQLMIRWVNYHLSKIPQQTFKTSNLGKDLKDGKLYAYLLNRLDPEKCNLKALSYAEPLDRMKAIISNALKLGAKFTLSIDGLVQGSNVLHVVLCCMLFNVAHALNSRINDCLLRHEFLRSLGG